MPKPCVLNVIVEALASLTARARSSLAPSWTVVAHWQNNGSPESLPTAARYCIDGLVEALENCAMKKYLLAIFAFALVASAFGQKTITPESCSKAGLAYLYRGDTGISSCVSRRTSERTFANRNDIAEWQHGFDFS